MKIGDQQAWTDEDQQRRRIKLSEGPNLFPTCRKKSSEDKALPGKSLSTETTVMLGFGGLIALVFLAFAAVKVYLWIRTMKRDMDVAQAPKDDVNLYYGMYYRSDDTRIDQSTVEIEHAND